MLHLLDSGENYLIINRASLTHELQLELDGWNVCVCCAIGKNLCRSDKHCIQMRLVKVVHIIIARFFWSASKTEEAIEKSHGRSVWLARARVSGCIVVGEALDVGAL